MTRRSLLAGAIAMVSLAVLALPAAAQEEMPLWKLYDDVFKSAKYIDLTHAFGPAISVWPGFGNAKFKPTVAGNAIEGYVKVGQEFTYKEHGFVATSYELPTDQYGTQLDPPAHWDEYGATISDLPASFTLRPLVVIDIHDKVAQDEGYHATVDDIKAWESKHGQVPEGAVVMIRSDWHKKWSDTARFNQKPFPASSSTPCSSCTWSARSSSTATSRSTPTPRRPSRARPG
jgi:kynurenine formamidase